MKILHKKGFTVIEVILVLGIAGLIFLTVFLVVPSLWASQRDAERRAKMTDFISALKEYQTNNSRGALPTDSVQEPLIFAADEASSTDVGVKTTWQAFVRDYFDRDFHDPSGTDFAYYVVQCAGINNDSSAKKINTGDVCTYNNGTIKPTSKVSGKVYAEINGGLEKANGNDYSINGGVNHVIYVVTGATCDGDQAVKSSNSRNVAVIYLLERAGRFCANT